jgi:hypothetical protein
VIVSGVEGTSGVGTAASLSHPKSPKICSCRLLATYTLPFATVGTRLALVAMACVQVPAGANHNCCVRLDAEYARRMTGVPGSLSDEERFAIEGIYYLIATGELEKAAQTYELWRLMNCGRR